MPENERAVIATMRLEPRAMLIMLQAQVLRERNKGAVFAQKAVELLRAVTEGVNLVVVEYQRLFPSEFSVRRNFKERKEEILVREEKEVLHFLLHRVGLFPKLRHFLNEAFCSMCAAPAG